MTSSEPKAVRLFVAVDMPEEAEDALEAAVAPWRARLDAGRWVGRDTWHVTLKFLGWVRPDLVEWVEEGCASVAAASRPFETSFTGLGVFPSPSRARVLWAGLAGLGLPGLAAAVEERLGAEFPPEPRGFTPHLTVARFKPPLRMTRHAEDLRATEVGSGAFGVDRLLLYRSHLSSKGASYEAVGEYRLG